MFFTKAGRVIAGLLVFAGALGVLMGLLARYTEDPALAADVLKGRSPGSLINAATYWLVLGLGLGILTEISRSVAPKDE